MSRPKMPGIPEAWTLMMVVAIWAPRVITAYSVPMENSPLLLSRSAGCSADYFACAESNLPSNFCCPSGSTCDVLAGNTTILCCPSGENCSIIRPISCDISLQNVDTYPNSSVKTTALGGVLTHCGSGTCCPFGYSCNGSGDCTKDADQNTVPVTTSLTSSATATMTKSATTASSSPTGSTSPKSTVAVVPTTDTSPTAATTSTIGAGTATGSESAAASTGSKSSKPFPTASVVGGVVGGLGGLLLIGAMVWAFMGYRLRRQGWSKHGMSDASSYKRSRFGSSFGNNIINNPLPISSPQLQEDTAFRTDFIRKRPGSPLPHATAVLGSDGGQRGKSPVFNYTVDSPPLGASGTAAVPPIRTMRGSLSRQQQQQWQREPGMEEINVGADPSIIAHGGFRESSLLPSPLQPPPALTTATGNVGSQRQQRGDRQTTFSDMMATVNLDLDRYVPDSVQSSPTARRR